MSASWPRAAPPRRLSHRRACGSLIGMRRYAEFIAMTDEELIADFDSGAEHVVVGKQWTLDERVGGRQARATGALQGLTGGLFWLPVATGLLTAVGAAASIVAALKA